MPLESSHPIKKPFSSLSSSPLLISTKETTTTLVWPDSPYSVQGQSDTEARSFTEIVSFSPDSVADPFSLTLSTPASTPETPEQLSPRPKSNIQPLTSDLLTELSKNLSLSLPPEERIVQNTNTSTGLCIRGAATSKSIASSLASPESSSTGLVRSSFTKLSTALHFILRPLNILASLRRHRPQAREGRIRAVIKLIEQVRDEGYPPTQLLIKKPLYSSEYQNLLARIESDEELYGYFYDRLRSEYSDVNKKFTIYMPTTFHSTFARKFHDQIRRFIDKSESSTNYSVIEKIARNLHSTGDRRFCPPESGKKEPDESYSLSDSDYPCLVVEVAWAASWSDMEEKVEYYFSSTQGQVRTVVGFNFNDIYKEQEAAERKWYTNEEKRKKEGSILSPVSLEFLEPTAAAVSPNFSVWRANTKPRLGKWINGTKSVEGQVFQNIDGQHEPDVSLELTLEDFVCEAALDKLCTEQEKSRLQKIEYPQLQISSELLCDLFQSAVQQNRPEWKQMQERKAKRKEQRKNDKMAAQKKKATALAQEAKEVNALKKVAQRGSSNRNHFARFGGVLRSVIRKDYKER